jgi:hypothetical protein
MTTEAEKYHANPKGYVANRLRLMKYDLDFCFRMQRDQMLGNGRTLRTGIGTLAEAYASATRELETLDDAVRASPLGGGEEAAWGCYLCGNRYHSADRHDG